MSAVTFFIYTAKMWFSFFFKEGCALRDTCDRVPAPAASCTVKCLLRLETCLRTMPADDRTIHVLKQVDVKAASKNVVAKPVRAREEEVGGGSRQMRKAESEIEAEPQRGYKRRRRKRKISARNKKSRRISGSLERCCRSYATPLYRVHRRAFGASLLIACFQNQRGALAGHDVQT
jgi:hypothetical protein